MLLYNGEIKGGVSADLELSCLQKSFVGGSEARKGQKKQYRAPRRVQFATCFRTKTQPRNYSIF